MNQELKQKLDREMFTILAAKKGFTLFTEPVRARLFTANSCLDLLTMTKESSTFEDFQKECEQRSFFRKDDPHRVTHFFYEAGFSFLSLQVDQELPLAIDIEYKNRSSLESLPCEIDSCQLELIKAPLKAEYEKAFAEGMQALKRGDCYQFNLTYPFEFKMKKNLSALDVFSKLVHRPVKRGAYAHATHLPQCQKLYFSNTPECLFQVYQPNNHQFVFESMPIKGTLKADTVASWDKAIEFFQSSLKDRGELNMITDLIRNDLSRLEKPRAVVQKQFDYLLVPGLYHQFSRIQVHTSQRVNVLKAMQAMFPGGSITGAPKKRVMEILKSLEAGPRGFYCGSTLVQSGKIQAASINIRSGLYQSYQQNLRLDAGGGVTLRSNLEDEWAEMLFKIASVTQLLGRNFGETAAQFHHSDMF